MHDRNQQRSNISNMGVTEAFFSLIVNFRVSELDEVHTNCHRHRAIKKEEKRNCSRKQQTGPYVLSGPNSWDIDIILTLANSLLLFLHLPKLVTLWHPFTCNWATWSSTGVGGRILGGLKRKIGSCTTCKTLLIRTIFLWI